MERHQFSRTITTYLLLIACVISGCTAARTYARFEPRSQQQNTGKSSLEPSTAPEQIYVSNFALDTEEIKEQKGILGGGFRREAGLAGSRLLQRGESPNTTAQKLVNTLAEHLTQDLTAKSLPAMRLDPAMPLPARGWLIRGQFLEVDKGNRLRRAVIGFGAGETNMQIEVTVTDLSAPSREPFLILGTCADSGGAPGAIVAMNPYVAAVKFVLSKNASEKDVKHCASQIASEVSDYMKTHGL